MAPSFDDQFSEIVRRARVSACAYLCDGDAHSAVVWNPASEITIRLSLRLDEVWVIAGSGMLLRFVAASDGMFDHEGIDAVIDMILRGEAVEYFGAVGHDPNALFATGHRVGGFAGGTTTGESLFQARLAGPLESARMDAPD